VTSSRRTSDQRRESVVIPKELKHAADFLERYAGCTFNHGIYRLHTVDEIKPWTDIVTAAFREYSHRVCCFSYDWLGRHFALDLQSKKQPRTRTILMFDVGAGEVLEIPVTFLDFHNGELVEFHDAVLASSFFSRWREHHSDELQPSQCVGYRRPLFLGGSDDISNLAICDMDVYWTVTGQLSR
jgi:hypothetical protein